MSLLEDLLKDTSVPAGGAAVAHTIALAVDLLQKTLMVQIRRSKKIQDGGTPLIMINKDLDRLLTDVLEEYHQRTTALSTTLART